MRLSCSLFFLASLCLTAHLHQDGSFTLTLFCPKDKLAELDRREKAKVFFEEHFPDALDWAGEERLLSDFEKNPRGALVTINVSRIVRI